MKADIKELVDKLEKRIDFLMKKLSIEEKKKKIASLEKETARKDLWKNKEEARGLLKKLGGLKEEIEGSEKIKESLDSLKELLEITEDKDRQDLEFIKKQAEKLKESLEKLELVTFLSGPYDENDAILSIHAGQGGTEACDWTAMLKRMYVQFIQKKNWKFEMVDQREGEEAGFKSVTFFVKGRLAYGFLKREAGTHRLVRLSPFNANNLRQTSFARVEVMPIFEKEKEEVIISPKDLEVDFFRSSGHGGQNVNKVSTAVRIKHIPSGIVVESQSQRYQEQNRKIAMQILQGKLWQLEEKEREEKKQEIKGEYKVAGWGNQIRSYVLQPYKLVKDLRTGWEEKDAQAVLDGRLDGFVNAELKGLNLEGKSV